MVADGLLTRQRYREVPPRVDYELTERARDLIPVLGALARWGLQWAWSPPKSGEAIDIGAIFRSAPGLLRLPTSLRGTLELTVGTGDGAHAYTFTVNRGRAELAEGPQDKPTARLRGSTDAWVKALGPARSKSALRRSGDSRLADAVLDGLAGEGASGAVTAVA